MGLRNQSSRRRTLKRIGAAMGVVWLAGCSDGGGPEDTEDGGTDGGADGGTDGGTGDGADGSDNETGGGDNETGGDNESAGADNESDGAGNESDGGGGGSGAIEPGTSIEFSAQTSAWVGIAPDSIADDENPPLTLQSGETYEIGWSEGDGQNHNIEIWDDNDEVIDDLSTEIVSEPEDQWLEFEASDEMAAYVCQPHQTTMVGEISVE